MAQIRGNSQILDASINWEKLESDFLDGADWDITNGANNAVITGLADPVNNRDVTNKQYVDGLVQGIKGQFVARVKAQSNVASLSGTQTVDGVALVDGDNVLLSVQTTSTEDGLYTVKTGAWERVVGWETGEAVGAFFVFVEEGTDDNKGFVCTNDKGSDVVGTDDLVFVQFSSAGAVTAGAGLVQNGTDIDVVATDLSINVNANDLGVNIGNTNGNSLEVSATGLELRTIITGGRNFNTGGSNFGIDAGVGNVDIVGAIIDFKDSEVSAAAVTTAIPLAITATADYGNGNGTSAGDVIDQFRSDFTDDGIINAICQVKAELDSQSVRKYHQTTSLNIGSQTATLDTAPTNGFTNAVIYLNGVRQILTTDYTVTNAATGEITFTSAQLFFFGDTVIMDYTDE